jgi:hypothetical protein
MTSILRAIPAAAPLAIAMLLTPGTTDRAPAQAAPDSTASVGRTASLVGEVQGAMTGDPAIGAIVYLRIADRGAVTDSAGEFRIDSISAGVDTLFIRYPGIPIQSTVMQFEPETLSRATFLLAQKIFQVAELQVEIARPTVDERAIARRMRTGQGVFVDRKTLLERATTLPSDALRGIPRIEVSVYGVGGQTVLFGYASSACRPAYLVDGSLMGGDFELDDVRIDDIELIELYRSPNEVPTQYKQDTNRCGLIAVRIRGGRDFRSDRN